MISILISNFMILVLFTYLGYSILSLRYKDKKINITLFVICFAFICLSNYRGPSKLGLFFLLIIHFIYFFIMFKAKIYNSLLVLFPFPIIIIMSEVITANILNLTVGLIPNLGINDFPYLCATLLSTFSIFLILLVYIKLSKLFMRIDLPSFTWMIFILPITTFILIVNLNEYNFYILRDNHYLFLAIIGLLISNFIIIFIFYKIIISYEDKKAIDELKSKQNFTAMKYELINNQHSTNFMFLHNLLHKCSQFNTSLESKNYHKLRTELNELYEVAFNEFNLLYSNSITINSIVNERLTSLEKNNIHIKTVITYNDFSFLDLYDQLQFFESLIDYGIHACLKTSKNMREIILKTSTKNKQLIIQLLCPLNNNDNEELLQNTIELILSKHDGILSIKKSSVTDIKSIIILFPLK